MIRKKIKKKDPGFGPKKLRNEKTEDPGHKNVPKIVVFSRGRKCPKKKENEPVLGPDF